ncbi:unnamed protein product [Calypogeia fissa]
MGYHSGLLFHRLLLLPFFVMLMLTVLYTSPTFRNFSPVKTRLSSLQDGIFPISLNIKDVVFRRHHVLNVEDARGVAKTQPVSRRHTDAVDSVDGQELTDVIVTEMVAAPSTGEQVEITNSGNELTFDAERFFQEQTDDLARIALPQENLELSRLCKRSSLDLSFKCSR